MAPSNGTRVAAAIAAAALLLPGSALAAKRHGAHHTAHKVRTSVSVPQPTIVLHHTYDAGGDGYPVTAPPPASFTVFDPVALAKYLGNETLVQLGLPPLP